MTAMDAAAIAAMEEPAPTDDELNNLDESVLEGTEGATEESPEDTPEEVKEPEKVEDPAEEEEEAPENPPEKKPVHGMIPRGRYNYARQKRQEAEARAQQLQEELERLRAKPANAEPKREDVIADLESQIDDLEDKIEGARNDGDKTLARQLRAQQRKLERQVVQAEMVVPEQVDPRAATQAAVEQMRVEALIPQLEAEFPMLQDGAEGFDAELSDEIMDTFDVLATKMSRDEALRRATYYVTAAHGIKPADEVPAKREVDKKRNLKAASKQPPELDAGVDSDRGGAQRKRDVMAMSQEDFEKLGDKDIEALLV